MQTEPIDIDFKSLDLKSFKERIAEDAYEAITQALLTLKDAYDSDIPVAKDETEALYKETAFLSKAMHSWLLSRVDLYHPFQDLAKEYYEVSDTGGAGA
jgi:hypothetical protein